MDDDRFDTLTKMLNTSPTRRGTLRLLAGVSGGLATLLGLHEREAGEASRRNGARQRNRKRKRKQERKRDRKQAQEQPVQPPSGACPAETKLCGNECIPIANCCTNTDCSGGKTCQQGTCDCPVDTPKLCDETCIPATNCCGDCPEGMTCEDGECVGSGESLYPDLRTQPATDLSFDLRDGTYVLRFSNTVWNAGEGRLELEGDPHPTA